MNKEYGECINCGFFSEINEQGVCKVCIDMDKMGVRKLSKSIKQFHDQYVMDLKPLKISAGKLKGIGPRRT